MSSVGVLQVLDTAHFGQEGDHTLLALISFTKHCEAALNMVVVTRLFRLRNPRFPPHVGHCLLFGRKHIG